MGILEIGLVFCLAQYIKIELAGDKQTVLNSFSEAKFSSTGGTQVVCDP